MKKIVFVISLGLVCLIFLNIYVIIYLLVKVMVDVNLGKLIKLLFISIDNG